MTTSCCFALPAADGSSVALVSAGRDLSLHTRVRQQFVNGTLVHKGPFSDMKM